MSACRRWNRSCFNNAQRTRAVPAEGARQASAIDTRSQEKQDVLDGTASNWRDQNMLARSYTAACHEGVSTLRATSEETENPLINATLIRPEAREACEQLALILVIVCRPAALDQVINASPGEILLARRLRCRRSGPRLHSAGVPLGLLNFDFSGGLLTRMEVLERELAQYVQRNVHRSCDAAVGRVIQSELTFVLSGNGST